MDQEGHPQHCWLWQILQWPHHQPVCPWDLGHGAQPGENRSTRWHPLNPLQKQKFHCCSCSRIQFIYHCEDVVWSKCYKRLVSLTIRQPEYLTLLSFPPPATSRLALWHVYVYVGVRMLLFLCCIMKRCYVFVFKHCLSVQHTLWGQRPEHKVFNDTFEHDCYRNQLWTHLGVMCLEYSKQCLNWVKKPDF